jgi:hypothetical protein
MHGSGRSVPGREIVPGSLEREPLAVRWRLQGDPAGIPLHRSPAQHSGPETGQAPRIRRVQHDLTDPADRAVALIAHPPMMADPVAMFLPTGFRGGTRTYAHQPRLRACQGGQRAQGRRMMYCNELASAQASATVPHSDRLRLAAAAYLARSRAPPESTPPPICAVISRAAPSAAWTRSWPGARIWSCASGGCRRSASSRPRRSPGGSRSPPRSGLAVAEQTGGWSHCWGDCRVGGFRGAGWALLVRQGWGRR